MPSAALRGRAFPRLRHLWNGFVASGRATRGVNERGGARRKQHYEVTRFGLQKHVAILAETTTIRLLFKAFPSVFQSKT